ncbi:MAG: SciE type virulence protein [Planctomycetota bacterium]|nr:SciE type virulence protein [Planctomycetaceae bacterium]MDQ3333208.1 SciE type virulence protein [Planctomycetota bacterium]
MTAAELFREGRLDDAISAQVEAVKSAPTDLGKRTFLFELYAFAGDLERAERQLKFIESQSTELSLATGAFRQCIEAELARRKVFAGEGEPHFIAEPPAAVRRHAEALRLLNEDRVDDARTKLAEAKAEYPAASGQANGIVFGEFRDADDLLAPVIEFYDGPMYCWAPLAQIRSFSLTAPKTPRDLLWNVCELTLDDDTVRSGVMPVLYPNSHESDDDAIRLGRQTDWVGYENGPTFGQGMRTFLMDGEERGMLELNEIVFRTSSTAPDA